MSPSLLNIYEFMNSNSVHLNQTSELLTSYDLSSVMIFDKQTLFFIANMMLCALFFLEIVQYMHIRAMMSLVQDLIKIEEMYLSEQAKKKRKPKPTRRSERLKLGNEKSGLKSKSQKPFARFQ
jgi:hypothetical protein